MNTEKKIAHKAARMTQNKLYALAASLYGLGIILALGACESFSAGFPMKWALIVVSAASIYAGEKLARLGEAWKK